jgi:hypothetical protein
MNLRKFYLARAIGFIVVLVLVLLYFYFFKSTPVGNENVNEAIKQDVEFKTNYIPNKWIIEDGVFYSPEMYSAREGGPYSLYIKINQNFSSVEDYLASKGDCVENKKELNINNNPAIQFIDVCSYQKPKITALQINDSLFEAFSYSFSDENNEIIKILNSLEIINIEDNSAELTDWLTFEDKEQNISFLYPETFSTSYTSSVIWPPKVSVSDMAYNCPVTEATSSLPDRTTERRVDNRTYCVTATSEGAAGSVFTDYTYSTVSGGKLINISFALRYPQCYNYDEAQKSACEGERETFDLDSVIDKIAQSVSY